MPRVCFTRNLQRHVDCPEMEVGGEDVRSALEEVFRVNPRLRSYVLNDQGALHRHMAIMLNGAAIVDRARLDQPLQACDELYVMQALSGG